MALLYKNAKKVRKAQIGLGGMGTGITATGDPMSGLLNKQDFDFFKNNLGNKKKKKKDSTELNVGVGLGTDVGSGDSSSKSTSLLASNSTANSSSGDVGSGGSSIGLVQKAAGGDGGGATGVSLKGNSWGSGALGKNMGGISAMGSMAGSAVQGAFGDDGDDNYTDGEAAAEIGGGVLKGAAAGASFGPVGAIVGGAIGGITSAFSVRKRRKEIRSRMWRKDREADIQKSENKRLSINNRAVNVSNSADQMYGTRIGGMGGGYALSRKGGKFYFPKFTVILEEPAEFENKLHLQDRPVKFKFRRGGSIPKFKKGGKVKPTENIIPNGVLHEEENSLGDKGMPVVKCTKNSCTKHYEIEKDEMILTLEATKKAEELAKKGDLKGLGEFMKKQILDNTHSYTEKFKHLNNDGTIFIENRG